MYFFFIILPIKILPRSPQKPPTICERRGLFVPLFTPLRHANKIAVSSSTACQEVTENDSLYGESICNGTLVCEESMYNDESLCNGKSLCKVNKKITYGYC
jgi:hypothetical protein